MTTLTPEAHELILFADNEVKLYPQKLAIIRNINRRLKKGTYDPAKAPKLWKYWFDAAAQEYTRQFDTPSAKNGSYGCFNAATRMACAQWYTTEHAVNHLIDEIS